VAEPEVPQMAVAAATRPAQGDAQPVSLWKLASRIGRRS